MTAKVTVTMIVNFNFKIRMVKKHFQNFIDIFNAFEKTYDIGNEFLTCMKNMIDWKLNKILHSNIIIIS